jgi:hypothetical protein
MRSPTKKEKIKMKARNALMTAVLLTGTGLALSSMANSGTPTAVPSVKSSTAKPAKQQNTTTQKKVKATAKRKTKKDSHSA